MKITSFVSRIEKPAENNFAAHITINNNENNYNLELIPNEKNAISHNDEEILPTPVPVPTFNDSGGQMESEICNSLVNDVEATNETNIDINNINKFVILRPKTCNNMGFSINKTKNDIKILSDETIVTADMKTNSLLTMKTSEDITRNSVNMELDTNTWLIDSNQHPTNIELSANPISHPVNITFSNHDSQSEPTQGISDLHAEKIESILTKTVNKRTLTKKPKNILSYVKDIHRTEDQSKIALNKLIRKEMGKLFIIFFIL